MYEQQFLLDDIDYKATEANVKHFLTRIYPRAKRMAGKDLSNIQSPQITDMPKATPVGNPLEQRIIQRAYAQQVVKATVDAIYRMPLAARYSICCTYKATRTRLATWQLGTSVVNILSGSSLRR